MQEYRKRHLILHESLTRLPLYGMIAKSSRASLEINKKPWLSAPSGAYSGTPCKVPNQKCSIIPNNRQKLNTEGGV